MPGRVPAPRSVAFAAVTQVTVLGGGQLGRMLGLAGIPLGLTFRFLDPSPDAPAAAVGELVVGGLDDVAAAATGRGGRDGRHLRVGGRARRDRAARSARDVPVLPSARALEVSQDRLVEKETFRSLGIATAPFRAVDDRASLDAAVADARAARGAEDPARRLRRQGPGRAARRRPTSTPRGTQLGGVPLILEGFVPFDRELSIIAVRGARRRRSRAGRSSRTRTSAASCA